MKNNDYAISRILSCDFDTAIERITNALKLEGFGILTEINLHDVFKSKLGKDFKKYKVLGACNPQYAFDAINKEDDIGLILPCKLAVQFVSENETRIAAIESLHLFNFINNPDLNCIRDEIREKISYVIETA